MRDRGVSEVISFALVFSLIVATVALVYVSGIGGLEATRSGEQVNNAERAFDVLADNIKDIHREGAPSRATEIKLSDAQMEFGDQVRFNVTIRNKLAPNASVITYRPITYSADSGTRLVYANGALFREDRGGTVMNREPSFLLAYDGSSDQKTVILPGIETRNVGPESIGGQQTVLVRTLLAIREVTIAEDNPGSANYILNSDPNSDGTLENNDPDNDNEMEYNVTVRIQTDEQRLEVWKNYLNGLVDEQPASANFNARGSGDACKLIDTDSDDTDDTVECSLAAERVYSTATRVDVSYE